MTAGAALAGLVIAGDAADGPILVARGNVAYFSGDNDAAWDAVAQARAAHLSWSAIGALVGTSGEAARQRYANKVA